MAENILHRAPREGDIDHRDAVQPALQVDHRYPNATQETREALRTRTIEAFLDAAAARQRLVFDEALPRHHVTELAHPGPGERAKLVRAARAIRQIGWRGAEWVASIRALNLTLTRQWRWLVGLSLYHRVNRDIYWNFDEPHRTPAGIPKGRPTDEDRAAWHPEPTLWDVEDAALHELELGMGGMASVLLHGQLPDPGQKRLKARSTVETYLMRNRQKIPADPYDPNEWGHDARLKALSMSDQGQDIALTPDFDPDVLAYTIGRPIAGSAITAEAFDDFASTATDYARDGTSVTVTVTAKDGMTRRAYKVTIAE